MDNSILSGKGDKTGKKTKLVNLKSKAKGAKAKPKGK